MPPGRLTMEDFEQWRAGKQPEDPDRDDVIEFDDVKYDDPEYRVITVELRHAPELATKAPDWVPAQTAERFLNDGWHLYNWIVSPPFVMLFFSREKESE